MKIHQTWMWISVVLMATRGQDPASEQLQEFKKRTTVSIGITTTSVGAPIDVNETNTLNSNLIHNEFFMDAITHFVRERIHDRVVHTKGGGAFGYFEVTEDITNICKAKLFSKLGKKTPIAVRFSPTILEKGAADTIRNPIGFAVKFYSEDGNFDIVGLSVPMFAIKDPLFFSPFVHCQKRNPATNLFDMNMFWDFVTLRPETILFFMWLFAGYGTPNTYRHMPGFGIHTYQLYNEMGDSFYTRFHFIPALGIKNLNGTEAMRLAAEDPDYNVRDLYNAIANYSLVSWNVGIQILTEKDVQQAKFDVFDVTKYLPLDKYPLKFIGKVVLNRNPKNNFAEIEQLAYCPGNVVTGILGASDKLFEGRRLSYRDAQNYRLGTNFNRIAVNCPFSRTLRYNRDGNPPVGNNMKDTPNYFPNSFNGPLIYKEENKPSLLQIHEDKPDNFDQASDLWANVLTKEQRNRLVTDISASLSSAAAFLQKRALKIFTLINEDLGYRLSKALYRNSKATDNVYK